MKSIKVLLLFCLAFNSLILTGQTKQFDSVNFWFNQAEKLSFEKVEKKNAFFESLSSIFFRAAEKAKKEERAALEAEWVMLSKEREEAGDHYTGRL